MKSKFALATLALISISAAADSPAQVKAAIGKQMANYVTALRARDMAKVESIIRANFAPEFKDISSDGKVRNLEQTITQMRMNVSILKSVKSASLVITGVKVAGDKATTSEVFKLDATIGLPNDQKPHSLKVDSTWTGTYAKKNGRWWCTSSKTTKENALIDGKKAS